jgi:autotransporter-associated beta strand protein
MFLNGTVNTVFDVSRGSERIGGNDAISGDGGFSKIGAGKLILGGSNSYTGATFVVRGTLQVDGSIVSTTDVMSHSTLDGRGSTGRVNVEVGGTLSPGDGHHGALHTGEIALHHLAHFAVQLAPRHSGQLDVTGSVNLTGAKLDLSLLGAFHGHNGETFEIINNDGIDRVIGHFTGLAQGAHLTAGGKVFSISYHGGDGNDVVLTEHGHATLHAVHHAHAETASDWLFT